MPIPKIEVKKVKFHKGHDGYGMNCDLYVDGKKVCEVHDDAWGGGFQYNSAGKTHEERKANREIVDALEKYAKTQTCISEFDNKPMTKNLDIIIDEIIKEDNDKKEAKKLEKKFVTHFILYNEKTGAQRQSSFGKPARLLSTIPVANLQKAYDDLVPQLMKNEKIINTNLEALGIVLKK
jgi:hypothetical protein